MSTTQSQASSNPKPTLHGVRIKQRKGVQKANAKHEPEIFRNKLLAELKDIKEGDFEAISSKLDTLGNTLEYRKYGDSLFEILITGGIIEPGGIIDNDAERCPFCVFAAEDDASVIKNYIDVFSKLTRRYKYLQMIFGDTLKNILQFANKWQPEENSKLAKSTGFLISSQIVSPSVLKVLLKDYLVKDGHSLTFTTIVFRTVLDEQNIKQLGRLLAKEDLNSQIIDFFPPNKREEDCLVRHFEAEDMMELVEYYRINKKNSMKEFLSNQLNSSLQDEPTVDKIQILIQDTMKEANLSEADVIPIFWESMMNTVGTMDRCDQIESQVLRVINAWSKVLEHLCASPKLEITLLQKVQSTCYQQINFQKLFRVMVQTLYKNDVLSDNAILYWYNKAHLPTGKSIFLAQMKPFVEWLKNNDSSDEDSD
ncbi:armadillo-type protein [Parasitella parasitica]|nr:armadillo-type protein [Parasitella parasitica]